MGSFISKVYLAVGTVRSLASTFADLSCRANTVASLPVANPTTSYWAVPPSPISQYGKDNPLPDYADVVIIGSGITGTSIARTLLRETEALESPVKVVMVEARDVCSGATARNGGHITPALYHDFETLIERSGLEEAKKIIKFRLAHLNEIIQVSREEHLDQDSQARVVQTFDVLSSLKLFKEFEEKLHRYMAEIPSEREHWSVVTDLEELEKLHLTKGVQGVISTSAGALHPYRLITGILSALLERYSRQFEIFSHTACTSISPPAPQSERYTVNTARGAILARHIVHATNGWSSHLLPGMRRKIVPTRAHMTAQRPGQSLGQSSEETRSWSGTRSFIFYPTDNEMNYDYLTQQPPASSTQFSSSKYPPPLEELMLGGGFMQGGPTDPAFIDSIGNDDDSSRYPRVISYLSGALSPSHFDPMKWGPEAQPSDSDFKSEHYSPGRVKMAWSGIIGFSADNMPWVGRIPSKITGRHTPTTEASQSEPRTSKLADCGEWISAGYSGEGMAHAWLCGRALAYMIMGKDTGSNSAPTTTDTRRETILNDMTPENLGSWFPDAFTITEERWKNANIENLL